MILVSRITAQVSHANVADYGIITNIIHTREADMQQLDIPKINSDIGYSHILCGILDHNLISTHNFI